MQVGGRAWRRGRQGYVEQSVSKTGERNNRGQQSPTCKMKKGREEGEVLGAEDQPCNEGRHAAHKSRCFGLPRAAADNLLRLAPCACSLPRAAQVSSPSPRTHTQASTTPALRAAPKQAQPSTLACTCASTHSVGLVSA